MSVGFAGGGDGGRTRVQKAIHDGIYKFSLSTTFPCKQADKQAVLFSSFISAWRAAKLKLVHGLYLRDALTPTDRKPGKTAA